MPIDRNQWPGAEDDLASDQRTLRLSTPVLTPERLRKLIDFERTWLEAAPRQASDPEQVARAHAEAIERSGLSPREVAELEAVVRDYAGRRSATQRLERRLIELSGWEQTGKLKPLEQEKQRRLEEELAQRDDLGRLRERYGEQAVSVMRDFEEELIAIHERLWGVLGPQR